MSALSSIRGGAGIRAAAGLCLAIIAALLLGLTAATPARAAGVVLPDGPMTLVIHKLAGAEGAGQPGTGLPPTGGSTVSLDGHSFTVKRVPDIDIRSTGGWNRAVGMTPAEARKLVEAQPVAAEQQRRADGSIAFEGLPLGLYYVEETASPAGVLRATPFLAVLPMPHPTEQGEWLTTVHVYPKNASVDVELGVRDRDAITCDDTVVWTSRNAIPALKQISSYRVQNILADDLLFRGKLSEIRVEITGQPALTFGTDYTVEQIEVDGRWGFETVFTDAGLAKLAVDTDAEVRISYDSHVAGPGVYTNEVRLFAGDADPVSDTATTKFGPLRILVHEKGKPSHLIAGADFRLYTSEADARAGRNPISVQGATDFKTDADGLITVGCLRFSNFADGLDVEEGSPKYRSYYAKPVSYPAGWTGDEFILRGEVTSATEPQTLIARVWKSQPGIPILTETGGKVAGVAILGGVLVAAGAVFLVRRRAERTAR